VKDFLDEATSKAFEFEFVKQEASTMLDDIRLALLGGRYEFVRGEYSQQEERLAWEGVSLLYGSVARTQEARTPAEKESRATTSRPPHYWELYLVRELSEYTEEDCLPLTLSLVPAGLWRDIANTLKGYFDEEDRLALFGLGNLQRRAHSTNPRGLPPEDQAPEAPF
jgi:hypothetical protein